MNRFIIWVAGWLLVLAPVPGSAEELPLWEAGIGFSGLTLPDYRGSDEQRVYLLPLPYLVYRGEVLRVDRKGMYGILFSSDRVHLNLSADAGVPVRSGSNDARAGMPDLDPSVQIGPSLEVCLSAHCTDDRGVTVRLPVRAVFATDLSSVRSIGYVLNPVLNVDMVHPDSDRGWNVGYAAGPLFATRKFHDYYYSVAPSYALDDSRDAYAARGGYSGFTVVGSLSKRFDAVWFGVFARYDLLEGSVFAGSPLVRTDHAFMAGFGVAWILGRSAVQVSTN